MHIGDYTPPYVKFARENTHIFDRGPERLDYCVGGKKQCWTDYVPGIFSILLEHVNLRSKNRSSNPQEGSWNETVVIFISAFQNDLLPTVLNVIIRKKIMLEG